MVSFYNLRMCIQVIYIYIYIYIVISNTYIYTCKEDLALNNREGARGVMAIVVGNGHGDTSSDPERDWLYFT